ncbi:hypothetical protein NHF50_09930 [Flavobacterium sp. NRK F10]|uniref:tetratricopeptide repeat-containing sensor histidine kinase n=1 Tax=Flavobacterium sp. NRK F10 TaxID=2954931 RepID=UPI0020913B44|nr:tetratricopeptide repeat-containing sensor histidine kinase [Flavobacterium sp. NRK F10]MCO6175361.1 hypothetical protein [Flavobacterium sp. NRK F10]
MKYFPFLIVFFLLISCSPKNQNKLLDSYIGKAKVFNKENKIDSAFYYFERAKELSYLQENTCYIVYILMKEVQLQKMVGDFSSSEETATEAIKYFEDCDSLSYKNEIYNCLGIISKERHDYDAALNYYYEILNTTSGILEKAIIKNNIIVVNIKKGNYEEAISLANELLKEDVLKRQDKKNYAKIIDNLGFAYFKKGDIDKAYDYLTESMRIRDSLGEDYERIASLVHLARFYQDSLPSLTVEYAQKAFQAASNIKSPDDQIEALEILIPNTSGIQSKQYFQDYRTINDSIDLVRQTAKNQFAKMKYDYSLISKDVEIQRIQKIVYLLLSIIVLLSSLYIFFHIKRKNKIKLQLENQKTAYETETRISRKLHDELANDVFQTLSFVQTQDLDKNRASLVNDLDEIYKKTRNISRENNDIVTGKDFEADLVAMISDFQDKEVRIIIKKEEVNLDQISPEKQIAVYRVLRELLVNMKKYSQASLVVLNFSSDKELKVNYSDNGIGFEKKNVKGGIQSAENRIHSVNGTITFDTMPGKGLKVSIVIPKN